MDEKKEAQRDLIIGALIEAPGLLVAAAAFYLGPAEFGALYYPTFAVAFALWAIGMVKMLRAAKRLAEAQKK